MNYTIRTNCIFCDNKLIDTFFKNDYNNYCGHYTVPLETELDKMINIPFNIFICSNCKTVQTKYLGDLNEIYKYNHATNTGTIMNNLHHKNLDLILKYKDNINNIIEIGCSKGTLSDLILDNIKLDYYIVEPHFIGNKMNKIVINDFYENVDDNNINADTIIISHVFEHFYNPKEILLKISNNKNIKNFFLVFPDLEYYINNNILHVLNTEHTYYVDNNFLINYFENYGFKLIEKQDYIGHSVLFYFIKNDIAITNNQPLLQHGTTGSNELMNINYSLDIFYKNIFDTVNKFNNIINRSRDNDINKEIYIWPASIHSLYLIIFGLNDKLLSGMLDNCKNKINNKLYGTNLKIFNFEEKIKENIILFITGGVFNKEIEKKLIENNIEYYI
jgi:hypothetical protein